MGINRLDAFKYNHCVGSRNAGVEKRLDKIKFKYNHCVGSSKILYAYPAASYRFKYNHCVGSSGTGAGCPHPLSNLNTTIVSVQEAK